MTMMVSGDGSDNGDDNDADGVMVVVIMML